MALLERINGPNDIKKIPPEEYGRLAEEIRQFLVEKVTTSVTRDAQFREHHKTGTILDSLGGAADNFVRIIGDIGNF